MRAAIVSLVVLGIGLLASARDAHAGEGTRTVASPVAIGGAITFGLAYTPMFILGATDTALQCTIGLLFDQCDLNPLVIPVAGPFIFAASPASAVSSDYRSIHEGKGCSSRTGSCRRRRSVSSRSGSSHPASARSHGPPR